jgi:hypothetical protein
VIHSAQRVTAGAKSKFRPATDATAPVKASLIQTKARGDSSDDLVYTPIAPCRILNTRNGTVPLYNAQMIGGAAFQWQRTSPVSPRRG